MEKLESLREYYEITRKEIPRDLLCKNFPTSHFNVLQRKNCSGGLPFARRDYWKISLLDKRAELETKDQRILINRHCIFFSNPSICYGWKSIGKEQTGFICLFNDQYLTQELRESFNRLNQLFENIQIPFLFLDHESYKLLHFCFQQMFDVYHSDFEYRGEVVREWLQLIIYQVIKIQLKSHSSVIGRGSGDRIVHLFTEALDAQFPVDSPRNPILLKTPFDFAEQLHIHVNHLNYCLKFLTGKSTTQHINERLVEEAVSLLENSSWNVSEIAESLGFEYVQHFTNFFKKQTGRTPKSYRKDIQQNI